MSFMEYFDSLFSSEEKKKIMQIKFYCCTIFKTEQTRKHTILAMKAYKKSVWSETQAGTISTLSSAGNSCNVISKCGGGGRGDAHLWKTGLGLDCFGKGDLKSDFKERILRYFSFNSYMLITRPSFTE